MTDNLFLEYLSVGLDAIHFQAGIYGLELFASCGFRAGYRVWMVVIPGNCAFAYYSLYEVHRLRDNDSVYARFRPSSSFPLPP